MSRIILYDYYRSSACYRVRIALNLKGVDYEQRPVNLLTSEQKSDEYRALNPQGLVPMLEIDGHRLTQSLAIINYLDLRFANQPLIPAAAAERAHVVAMAMAVACDIHPLNNLRVLKYLKNELGHSQEEVDAWYVSWAGSIAEPKLDEVVEFEFVGGGEGAMTRGQMLLHVVNHTSYHRGFVADMFCQVPARPPVTDLTVYLRDVEKPG